MTLGQHSGGEKETVMAYNAFGDPKTASSRRTGDRKVDPVPASRAGLGAGRELVTPVAAVCSERCGVGS